MRHPGKSVSNITNAQSQSRADISAGRGSKNENRPSPTIGGNPTNLPKSQPGDGKIKQLVAGRCKIKQSELNENVNDNSTKYTAIKTTHFKRCFIFSCFIATMCILSIWSLTTHNTHCDVHYSNVHNYTFWVPQAPCHRSRRSHRLILPWQTQRTCSSNRRSSRNRLNRCLVSICSAGRNWRNALLYQFYISSIFCPVGCALRRTGLTELAKSSARLCCSLHMFPGRDAHRAV